MNHTCLCLPAEAGTHLPTPEGWKAELALGGWLVFAYRNKCPQPYFLLVINTNLVSTRILHRSGAIAFDKTDIAIRLPLLCLTPLMKGFS